MVDIEKEIKKDEIEFVKYLHKKEFWMIVSAVLLAALIVSIAWPSGVSSSKAGNLLLGSLNEQTGGGVTLKNVSKMGSLYVVNVVYQNQEIPVYMTSDGKYMAMGIQELKTTKSSDKPAAQNLPKSDKPEVQLFIMSFCPYGLQAVGAFADAINLLSPKIDFSLGYVIYANFAKNYGQSWEKYCTDSSEKYCSMHGIEELREDVRQLCIQKYEPSKLMKYMSLVVADYNAGKVSVSNIATKWKTYASTAGIATAKIEECLNKEANEILAGQVALTDKYSVQGSPSTLINGQSYSGARNSEAFKSAICGAFNTAPELCSQKLTSQSASASGSC